MPIDKYSNCLKPIVPLIYDLSFPLDQEQQMAKVRADQLAALRMFSDDSEEDGEQDTAEDVEMESADVGEANPAKTILVAEETGKSLSSALVFCLIRSCP